MISPKIARDLAASLLDLADRTSQPPACGNSSLLVLIASIISPVQLELPFITLAGLTAPGSRPFIQKPFRYNNP